MKKYLFNFAGRVALVVLGFQVLLPLIMSAASPASPDVYISRVPRGLGASFQNPQFAEDSLGNTFWATRPDSGIGGLVWKVFPSGEVEVLFADKPREFYAVGEFTFNNNGDLYYVTVPDPDPDHGGDNLEVRALRVPGWENQP